MIDGIKRFETFTTFSPPAQRWKRVDTIYYSEKKYFFNHPSITTLLFYVFYSSTTLVLVLSTLNEF